MSKSLSERRKADRREMTLHIEELVRQYGCTSKRREGGEFPGPRSVRIEVQAPEGLRIAVSFDGDSTQPDVHVLSWNVDLDFPDTKLDPNAFGASSVNPHHFQKATSVCYGFDQLCQELARVLLLAVTGEAFKKKQKVCA